MQGEASLKILVVTHTFRYHGMKNKGPLASVKHGVREEVTKQDFQLDYVSPRRLCPWIARSN